MNKPTFLSTNPLDHWLTSGKQPNLSLVTWRAPFLSKDFFSDRPQISSRQIVSGSALVNGLRRIPGWLLPCIFRACCCRASPERQEGGGRQPRIPRRLGQDPWNENEVIPEPKAALYGAVASKLNKAAGGGLAVHCPESFLTESDITATHLPFLPKSLYETQIY